MWDDAFTGAISNRSIYFERLRQVARIVKKAYSALHARHG